MSEPIVEVVDLVKHFPLRGGLFDRRKRVVKAVDGVSLAVEPGKTLGLVGESGCGKSTLGRVLLKLIPPTGGAIRFEGKDITARSPSEMRPLRRNMQIVFQDPYASLNPRLTIEAAVSEALWQHGLVSSAADASAKVAKLLERVGLRADHMRRYPHEFSGGQRQRIVLARALAVEPRFIVADEPVSALDVSVQAQIVNLFKDLQDELGLSFLFVAHDLAVVRWMSHRVAVMYLGKVVELAESAAIWSTPRHPYTKALMSAVRVPVRTPGAPPAGPGERAARERIVLTGDAPSPIDPPSGCRFHPRCPIAEKGLCDVKEPKLEEKAPGHLAACHLA